MFCSKCGTELEEDSKFCNKCGEKINKSIQIDISDIGNTVTQSIKNFDIDETKEKVKKVYHKSPKLIICIGIVIGILLILWMSSNAHTCDTCGKTFFGTQYYDSWYIDKTMCEDCAREYYAPLPYQNYKK